MANRINKAFAEDLGQSLGGCATELTLGLYYKEAAHAAKAGLSFIPFFGQKKRRRFQILWSCVMEAVALWVARQQIAELREDDKLSNKTLFYMQVYDNEILSKNFTPYFTEAQMQDFAKVRKDFIRMAHQAETTKETFARAFLSVLHQTDPSQIDAQRIQRVTQQMGLAMNVFEKMVRIHLDKLEQPQSTEA